MVMHHITGRAARLDAPSPQPPPPAAAPCPAPRTHLQDAQRVVQHRFGVGDVVGDGQRRPPQVRLQQQVGLGVRVVWGAGRGRAGEKGAGALGWAAVTASERGTRRRRPAPPTCGAAVGGPADRLPQHNVQLVLVVAHGQLIILGRRAQHGQQGLRGAAGGAGGGQGARWARWALPAGRSIRQGRAPSGVAAQRARPCRPGPRAGRTCTSMPGPSCCANVAMVWWRM